MSSQEIGQGLCIPTECDHLRVVYLIRLGFNVLRYRCFIQKGVFDRRLVVSSILGNYSFLNLLNQRFLLLDKATLNLLFGLIEERRVAIYI